MFKKMIEIFLAVVQEGSFSGAARRLYISQSAVSQQIDKLEAELGIKLFDRTSYRPSLNRAGQYYYEEVKKLEEQYQRVENALKQFNRKRVIIGITSIFEKQYLPAFIKQYHQDHDLTLALKYYPFGLFKPALDDHQIDLAFGLMDSFENVPGLYSQVCYQAHVCVIVSLDHPFAKYHDVDIKALEREPVVVLGENLDMHYYQALQRAFEKDGYRPHIVKTVDTQEDLVMSVQMNEGIAFTAREVIQSDDQVCILDLKNSHHHASYGVAYKNKDYQDIAKAMADYFKTL